MSKHMGLCRLCGNVRLLSREHGIPESSGNSGRVEVHNLYSLSRGWARGQIFQNGMTSEGLCEPCNGHGGRHYVPAFAQWTLQGMTYYRRLGTGPQLYAPFTCTMLAVAKQIAMMVLSLAHAESISLSHFRILRSFAAHPLRRQEIEEFRFFVYLHEGEPAFNGLHYALDTRGGPSPTVHCHVGKEPLGYIVTGPDEASRKWAKSTGMCDITHFARRHPNVITTEYLQLRRLRGGFPLRPMPRQR